jgi:hypothetical protein
MMNHEIIDELVEHLKPIDIKQGIMETICSITGINYRGDELLKECINEITNYVCEKEPNYELQTKRVYKKETYEEIRKKRSMYDP